MSMMVDEADVDLMGSSGSAGGGSRGSKRPAETQSPSGRPNKRRRGPLPMDFTIHRINKSPSSSPNPSLSPNASPCPSPSPSPNSSPCGSPCPSPTPPPSPISTPNPCPSTSPIPSPVPSLVGNPSPTPSPPGSSTPSRVEERPDLRLDASTLARPDRPDTPPVFQPTGYVGTPTPGYSPGIMSVSPPGSPASPSLSDERAITPPTDFHHMLNGG